MTFQLFVLLHLNLVLFTAKASLAWVLFNYGYPSNPMATHDGGVTLPAKLSPASILTVLAKGVLLAVMTAWFADWHIAVGMFTFMAAIALTFTRSRMPPVFLAELEIAENLLFLCGVCSIAWLSGAQMGTSGWFGISGKQVGAADFIVAIVVEGNKS